MMSAVAYAKWSGLIPDLVNAYRAYTEQITEGQRFVSTGQHAPQNWQELTNHTQHAGSTPIFSTNKDMAGIWEEVRGGQDPLHVLERELDRALSNRMQNESHWNLHRQSACEYTLPSSG
jgi:hypothetical protein